MQDSDLQSLSLTMVQEYILEHRNDDPARIALLENTPAEPRLIADQVKCRIKADKKFPFLAGRPFIFDSRALEQSSSEATSRYKAGLVHGESLIDITGGMGMDCHFMSGKFHRSVYIDRNEGLCRLCRKNRALNGWPEIDIRYGDGLAVLESFPTDSFDWLFVDPDRREDGSRHIALKNCVPDVAGNMDLLFSRARQVMVKLSPAFDVTEALRAFKNVQAVYVVSVAGECKEVLAVCGREPADVRVTAAALDPAGNILHSFTGTAQRTLGKVAECGKYLFIPDPALVQSRLTGTYGRENRLFFLNDKVDILTGNDRTGSFFGKQYEIRNVIPWQRKKVAAYCKDNGIGTAALTVKWARTSIRDVAEMLGIGNGEGERLVFTYDQAGMKVMVHVKAVDN